MLRHTTRLFADRVSQHNFCTPHERAGLACGQVYPKYYFSSGFLSIQSAIDGYVLGSPTGSETSLHLGASNSSGSNSDSWTEWAEPFPTAAYIHNRFYDGTVPRLTSHSSHPIRLSYFTQALHLASTRLSPELNAFAALCTYKFVPMVCEICPAPSLNVPLRLCEVMLPGVCGCSAHQVVARQVNSHQHHGVSCITALQLMPCSCGTDVGVSHGTLISAAALDAHPVSILLPQQNCITRLHEAHTNLHALTLILVSDLPACPLHAFVGCSTFPELVFIAPGDSCCLRSELGLKMASR